jgi:hypothetical protein
MIKEMQYSLNKNNVYMIDFIDILYNALDKNIIQLMVLKEMVTCTLMHNSLRTENIQSYKR